MSEFNQRYLEFCGPFVAAVKEIYSTMLSSEVTPGQPAIKRDNKSFGCYSAMMGINGIYQGEGMKKIFKGALVLSWPEETYLKSASAMLMEEYTEFNDEIADVGMEICNITMGSAKKILVQKGYNIEMSIPTSVRGMGHEISVQKGIITIATPLKSKLGEFSLELNYEDSDA